MTIAQTTDRSCAALCQSAGYSRPTRCLRSGRPCGSFIYSHVNTTLEIPPDIHATGMVLFKTRLDKRETSCCVHIVCCALSQQRAATCRNIPQRAASHTVEEREHHANFYIAFDINSNSWPKQQGISHSGVKLRPKHWERRHSVYINRPSPFTHAGSARSREKSTFNR